MNYTIEYRQRIEVNTDPQRRCYYGVYYSSELRWTDWDWLQVEVPAEKVESRLTFWRELNEYAVSERGELARSEYRAVPEPEEGVC